MKAETPDLSPHDLVVMAVLAEGPVHGYRLMQTLEERDVQDWAAMSKPQVYYSLKKLKRLSLVAKQRGGKGGPGPDREVLSLTSSGQRALIKGLDSESWATQRPPPPFLTWLALSTHLPKPSRAAVIAKRQEFLLQELAREQGTLAAFQDETGLMSAPGKLMVEFTVMQFELELRWLENVRKIMS